MPPVPSMKELISFKDSRGDILFISRLDRPTVTHAYMAGMHVQLPERAAVLLNTPDIRTSVFLSHSDLQALMRMAAVELGSLRES